MAASALLTAMIGILGQGVSAACAVEGMAERVGGFPPQRSAAVSQAVGLMQQGDYSLALFRLCAEQPAASTPAQVRVFSAYVVLVAGKTLGAFPVRG